MGFAAICGSCGSLSARTRLMRLPFIAVTWGDGSLTASEMHPGCRAAAQPSVLGEMLLAE